MEKVILTKNGARREFTRKAADIAVANLGWSELPPVPPELLGNGPIMLKRKIEPPEVKAVENDLRNDPEFANMDEDYLERNKIPVEQRPGYEETPSEPEPDAKQPEVIEKPKVKRSPRKK